MHSSNTFITRLGLYNHVSKLVSIFVHGAQKQESHYAPQTQPNIIPLRVAYSEHSCQLGADLPADCSMSVVRQQKAEIVAWVWRLWRDNVVNLYSRCVLLYASSCCSKRLSEIQPRLGTKTRPAALVSQAALAGNGVFNLSWRQTWAVRESSCR